MKILTQDIVQGLQCAIYKLPQNTSNLTVFVYDDKLIYRKSLKHFPLLLSGDWSTAQTTDRIDRVA